MGRLIERRTAWRDLANRRIAKSNQIRLVEVGCALMEARKKCGTQNQFKGEELVGYTDRAWT